MSGPRLVHDYLADMLIHRYFGVNLQRIYATVRSELPPLREHLQRILAALEQQETK
ncbi:MAG: HepT-like ribonuclease domain-containing protein [Caldilineaceae bacterium]